MSLAIIAPISVVFAIMEHIGENNNNDDNDDSFMNDNCHVQMRFYIETEQS